MKTVTLTKEELNEMIESAVKRCRHEDPSPRTLEMFSQLNSSFQEFKEEMKPVVEFFHTVNSLNKFFKWGGLSLFAVLTAFYYFIKKL